MTPMTLAEVAAVVGGVLVDVSDPAAELTADVVSDSRDAAPGTLFVCIRGERVDGHDHAAAAVGAGAVAVLAARPVGVPAVVVADPVAALGRLAAVLLARLPDLRVVGITGSAGKTSTKDVMSQVVARLGATVAPVGSLNTEVGLPVTVLRADETTRYLVLEYSARGIGHIAYLTGIARPDIAVVLNVGTAHLGEFGSRDAVARAKGELVEALAPDGVAVLNADDPAVAAMARRTAARVVTTGRAGAADVRATDVTVDESGRAAYTLVTADGEASVRLRLVGEHHVDNTLAVAAAALELGLPLDATADALSAAEPRSRWRMEVTERADGITVINDAYNANPESMRAALRALRAMTATTGRRGWAVLGPMAELGVAAADEHVALGRAAVELGVARVVAVGEAAAGIVAGAHAAGATEAVCVADADEAADLLRAQLRPRDVVLVKASRSAGLERLAQALVEATEVPA